jgi:hypothetical protein
MATAQAQGAVNADTAKLNARLNRVDQITPYGNLTYNTVPGFDVEAAVREDALKNANNPDYNAAGYREAATKAAQNSERYSATTTLSPAQQRQLDLTNQAQELYGTAAVSQLGQVQNALSKPFQYQGPDVQTSVQDRSGGVQNNVQDRAGALNYLIPGGYEEQLQRSVQNRTGEVQRGVQDRTGNIQTRADFTGIGDANQSRDAVQNALFARINPQLETQRAALEARLVNQGITPGSQAWETGMRDYAQQANDARYGAILNAGQEQSRIFGLGFGQTNLNNQAVGQQMGNDLQRGEFANNATQQVMSNDLQRGQFANQAAGQAQGMYIDRANFNNQAQQQAYGMDLGRAGLNNQAIQQQYGMDIGRGQFGNAAVQQSLQQQLALRGQPINEASALLSGQQIQYPQFQNAPQVQIQAPDYQGMVAGNYGVANSQYNANVAKAAADNAAMAQFAGQVAGAGASAAMKFSDRRLKRNAERIGTGLHGLPIYRYEYLWGEPAIGYMADDVAAVAPHAVKIGPDGFAQVDYGALA